MTGISVVVEPYDHTSITSGPAATGVTITTATSFPSGRVFSAHFPTLYVDDAGAVEMSEATYTVEDFLLWLDQVKTALTSRLRHHVTDPDSAEDGQG